MNNTPPLSFVFFGTPDVSAQTLELLKASGYLPRFIVTSPDRPVGRHFTMTPSPTKVWVLENTIPYLQPEKITPEIIEQIPDADVYIVVAYGKILPQLLIDKPRYATLNIHYSLLPKYRGASPVESALLHGDTETGVSIQQMVFKLDAGPVIAEERTPIDPNETHTQLRNRLIPMGAELLATKILPFIREDAEGKGVLPGTPQDESLSTHCGKIKKEDGLIDPSSDDPRTLWNKYRAYEGWPGIYFFDDQGKRVKITKASFTNNCFVIERVIREGKPESDYN